jgi:hypothetical protein
MAIAAIMAVAPWFYLRYQQSFALPDLPYYVPYPQGETPITKIVKEEVALSPGSTFRGRVVNMTGRMFPVSTNVDIDGLWGLPRFLATHSTGNSHEAALLWQDSIPTLLEYNPLTTPPYFAFVRRFFTESRPISRFATWWPCVASIRSGLRPSACVSSPPITLTRGSCAYVRRWISRFPKRT